MFPLQSGEGHLAHRQEPQPVPEAIRPRNIPEARPPELRTNHLPADDRREGKLATPIAHCLKPGEAPESQRSGIPGGRRCQTAETKDSSDTVAGQVRPEDALGEEGENRGGVRKFCAEVVSG